MMKQQNKNTASYAFEEFPEHINLWTLIPGGSGKGVVMLRKIVDSVHAGTCRQSQHKLPSFLIIGENGSGRNMVARALANSLAMQDIRVCPVKYLDNGINSGQFFFDSSPNTAHIITDLQEDKRCECTLWRYLTEGKSEYFNIMDMTMSNVVYCNGLIILTSVSMPVYTLAKAVTFMIHLEVYTAEQIKCILHQYLHFMGIAYEGEAVLDELVQISPVNIHQSLDLLKVAVNIMRADLKDCLTAEAARRTKRLMGHPVSRSGQNKTF